MNFENDFKGYAQRLQDELAEKNCFTKTKDRIEAALDILGGFFDGEWGESEEDLDENSIIINGRIIHLFVVGQGVHYEIESKRGHIFALQKGYPTMYDVNPMDIIFSCQGGEIKSINIALESAEKTYGTKDGLRIDGLYSELSTALDIVPLRPLLAGLSPFNANGHLPQSGYIHHLNVHAAKLLMAEIKKLGNRPRK